MINAKVNVTLDLHPDRPSINIYDLTDKYNDTKGFTRNKRGLTKAWMELEKRFNETMSFYEVVDFLDSYKLNVHTYCGMD